EPEFVDLLELLEIVKSIGRVTVDVNDEIGKSPSHRADDVDTPTGPKFQFDPAVSERPGRCHRFEQGIHTLHHAEIRSHRRVLRATPEEAPERARRQTSGKVPPGQIKYGPGERIPFEGGELGLKLRAPGYVFPNQTGREPIAGQKIGAAGPF